MSERRKRKSGKFCQWLTPLLMLVLMLMMFAPTRKLLLLYRRREQEDCQKEYFYCNSAFHFAFIFDWFSCFAQLLRCSGSKIQASGFLNKWWVLATNIFWLKYLKGRVFSNYSYYEHFFSFCFVISSFFLRFFFGPKFHPSAKSLPIRTHWTMQNGPFIDLLSLSSVNESIECGECERR